jgi:hypothetical protein
VEEVVPGKLILVKVRDGAFGLSFSEWIAWMQMCISTRKGAVNIRQPLH